MSRRHGYLLVLGTAHDRAGMDRYQAELPPIYGRHGGYRLVMGDHNSGVAFLAGGLANLGVMIARFPTPEAVSEFWWSDDYREAYTHRKDAGRFSAVAVPGLDREPDPIPGNRGYLIAMAAPQSPGFWRRFADPFLAGVETLGGTVLADSGPEAVERLESLLPGSHVIVTMFENKETAQRAWDSLANEIEDQRKACDPVNIVVMSGLPEDHPERLNLEKETA